MDDRTCAYPGCDNLGEQGVYRRLKYCGDVCRERDKWRKRSPGARSHVSGLLCVVCGEPIGPDPYRPFGDGVKHNRCFEHGTEYGYGKHGCRCDECSAVMEIVRRERWEQWKAANPGHGEAYNARRRAERASRAPKCAVCGDPVVRGTRTDGTSTHSECREFLPHWKQKGRSEPPWFTSVRRRLERAERGVYRDRPFIQGPCAVCGQPFLAAQGVYCSDECKQSAKVARRGSFGLSAAERDALYARDKFICHLCGRKVDTSLTGWDDAGPSLDHVVPRSHGGSDDPENLRLAHRLCNSIRRDLAVREARQIIRTGAELSLLW